MIKRLLMLTVMWCVCFSGTWVSIDLRYVPGGKRYPEVCNQDRQYRNISKWYQTPESHTILIYVDDMTNGEITKEVAQEHKPAFLTNEEAQALKDKILNTKGILK